MASERREAGRVKRRMEAEASDPWIGVHVLTEFIFCPRAGVVAYEQRGEDQGVVEPQGRALEYVPTLFELRDIETRLESELHRLGLYAAGLVCGVLLVSSLALLVDSGCWMLLLGLCGLAYPAVRCVVNVVKLSSQRKQALGAAPAEPDEKSKDKQSVNWWEMREAGYETVYYKEQLRDGRWNLVGRPWCVLRRGGTRIPVFRLRGTTHRTYRQHYVRMAAYCHLLKTCECAESPYGIVLYPDSYDGVTVPDTFWSGRLFHEALLDARAFFRAVESGEADLPAPPEKARCSGCGVGYPRVHRPGQTETVSNGRALAVFSAIGVDRRAYHSPCGDRFRWVPPHQRASEKRLRQ